MALRITVPPAALSAGLDSLFVFGVAGSLTAADTAKQFANLLDAHHYTDGLEFLHFGTPTNNTDERRAAATHDDPAHERSFAIEVAADPTALDAQSNAMRVGTALGLPSPSIAPVLGHIGQAAEHHELDMRSMNAALWQVGWGYYLSNMVGFDGTGLTTPILAWARDHFVNHVRSGGPYPTLRCGRQPYGVLPVTSLDAWKPPAGQEQAFASDSWLRDLLLKLRNNIWRPRLGDAFRIGRRSPSAPDADLADIMRMDAIASGYSARSMLGRHYLQHLRAFLGEDLQATGFIATHDALAAGVLQRLGIAWRPRLSRTVGCRIRLAGIGAAGAGRRGVAVAQPRAELHRDAAGSAQHRSPDAGAARSGSPTPARQPAAAPAAPCAAARAGRRRAHSWAAAPTPRRCCATPSSSTSSPISRRRHRRRRGRGISICRRPASPATRPCGNISKGSPPSTRRRRPRSAISAAASPSSRTATARPCNISCKARSISRRIGSMRGSHRSPPNGSPP